MSVYPQEGRPGVLQDNGLAEPHPLTSLMLGPPLLVEWVRLSQASHANLPGYPRHETPAAKHIAHDFTNCVTIGANLFAKTAL